MNLRHQRIFETHLNMSEYHMMLKLNFYLLLISHFLSLCSFLSFIPFCETQPNNNNNNNHLPASASILLLVPAHRLDWPPPHPVSSLWHKGPMVHKKTHPISKQCTELATRALMQMSQHTHSNIALTLTHIRTLTFTHIRTLTFIPKL